MHVQGYIQHLQLEQPKLGENPNSHQCSRMNTHQVYLYNRRSYSNKNVPNIATICRNLIESHIYGNRSWYKENILNGLKIEQNLWARWTSGQGWSLVGHGIWTRTRGGLFLDLDRYVYLERIHQTLYLKCIGF